jgi:hypothetical protein
VFLFLSLFPTSVKYTYIRFSISLLSPVQSSFLNKNMLIFVSALSGPKEFTSVFYSLQNWRVR